MNNFLVIIIPFIAIYSRYFYGYEVAELIIYLLLIVSIIYSFNSEREKTKINSLIILTSIILIIHSCSNDFNYKFGISLLLSFIFGFIFKLIYKKIEFYELVIIFLALLSLTSIFHWINMKEIYIKIKNCGFFIIILYIIGINNFKVINFKVTNFLIMIFSMIASIWLSFRIDTIFYGDGPAHWSYYISPIHFFREGLFIINETPSQYGFLTILLPSLLPYSDWQSFFIFQIILSNLIVFMLTYIIFKSNLNILLKLFINFTFILAIYLSTNNFISFSTIPSGSVIRFFPLYLIIFIIYCYRNKLFLLEKILPIIVGITFFWSIEIFIICLLIYICTFYNYKALNNIKRLVYIVGTITFVQLVLFVIYKKFLNLTLYVLYPYIYTFNGVGSLPMKINDPFWMILFLIYFLHYSYKLDSRLFLKTGIYSILFASIYYLNRSTPWNITVLIPLFYFVMILSYFENIENKIFKVIITIFSIVIILNNALLINEVHKKIQSIKVSNSIDKYVLEYGINLEIQNLLQLLKPNDNVYYVIDDDSYSYSGLGIALNGNIVNKFLLPTPLSLIKGLNQSFSLFYIQTHLDLIDAKSVYFIQLKNPVNNFINIEVMTRNYRIESNGSTSNYNYWILNK